MPRFATVVVLSLLLLCIARSTLADLPPQQKAALEDIYDSTRGEHWKNNAGWLAGDPCSWFGVTCNPTRTTVTTINLSSNNLVGTIPNSIGELVNMTDLVLQNNPLHGVIPSSVGNLAALRKIILTACGLSGSLPNELAQLTNLVQISVSANEFHGDVPDLSALSQLETLDLSYCEFDGNISTLFTTSSGIQSINAQFNHFTGSLPANIGDLTLLTSLLLYSNDISGEIPSTIGGMASLENLQLGANSITGRVPDEMGMLSSLKLLQLTVASLEGGLPDFSGTSLEQLDVSYCGLDGDISFLSNLPPSIRHVNAQFNHFTGSLPANIGDLTLLKNLILYSNDISGEIPTTIGGMASLENLQLGANSITGRVPDEMGMLSNLKLLQIKVLSLEGGLPDFSGTSLEHLDASYCGLDGNISFLSNLPPSIDHVNAQFNHLTGSLPANIGDLTLLKNLILYSNDISGEIPTTIGGMASLQTLQLGANNITGRVPDEMGLLSNLKELRLTKALLEGGLPDFSGTSLEDLDVSYCGLDGDTSFLATLPGSIRHVNAQFNHLTGSLPANIGDLTLLKNLILYSNDISGEIPSTIGGMASLETLQLGVNDITGRVPDEMGMLSNLRVLQLTRLSLEGGLPDLSGTSLEQLDVSYCGLDGDISFLSDLPQSIGFINAQGNSFHGELGTEIGSLNNLTDLILTSNMIHGTLPSSIGGLKALKNLNLGLNQFTGEVPQELGVLSSLEVILLRNNRFSGTFPQLWDLDKLKVLHIFDCNFDGDISWLASLPPTMESILAHSNEFSGSLPMMGHLFNVNDINLGLNALVGDIPESIGGMTSLEHLALYSNMLSGQIPSQLQGLTGLIDISFRDNRLTGAIPNLMALTKLETLDLARNQFDGSLQWLSELSPTIHFVNADDNAFSDGLPSAISHLLNLETLQLARNNIANRLPASIGALTSLRVCSFAFNEIQGPLPPELNSLASLETLDISFNSIDGNLVDLSSLANLRVFSCSENSLSGDVDPSYFPASLEILRLEDNALESSIPSTIDRLMNLKDLRMDRNFIQGPIPSAIGSLVLLETLTLSGNRISGSLPTEISQLVNLKTLHFADNSILGELPDFSALSQLEGLQFQNNHIVGTEALGTLPPSLRYLLGGSNRLSGTLPIGLGLLPHLETLELYQCELSGEIPSSFGNLISLRHLSLFQNFLSGSIPEYLATFPLDTVLLFSNMFFGDLRVHPLFQSRPTASTDLRFNSFHCPLPEWCSADGDRSCTPCAQVDVTATVFPVVTTLQSPPLNGFVSNPLASVSVEISGAGTFDASSEHGVWRIEPGDIFPPLADGTYDITLHITVLGSQSLFVAPDALTVDTVVPEVDAELAPVSSSRSPALRVTVSDADENVLVWFKVQGVRYDATRIGFVSDDGTSAGPASDGAGERTKRNDHVQATVWEVAEGVIDPLEDGMYTIEVNVEDHAGNVAQLEPITLEIDTRQPLLLVDRSVVSAALWAHNSSVTGRVSEPCLVFLQVGESSVRADVNESSLTWSAELSRLDPKLTATNTYQYEVTARDYAGNEQVATVVGTILVRVTQDGADGEGSLSPGGMLAGGGVQEEEAEMAMPELGDGVYEEEGASKNSSALLLGALNDPDSVRVVIGSDGNAALQVGGDARGDETVLLFEYVGGASVSVSTVSPAEVGEGQSPAPRKEEKMLLSPRMLSTTSASDAAGVSSEFPPTLEGYERVSVSALSQGVSEATFEYTTSEMAEVVYTSAVVRQQTQVQFSSERVQVAAGTLKTSVQVRGWPFSDPEERLVYEWAVEQPSLASLVRRESIGDRRLLLVLEDATGQQVEVKFFEFALADGIEVPVEVALHLNRNGPGRSVVAVTFPFFSTLLDYDPDIRVLLGGNDRGGSGGSSRFVSDPILWLSVSFFVAAICLAVVVAIFVTRCPFAQRLLHRNKNMSDLRKLRAERKTRELAEMREGAGDDPVPPA